jgi:EAL domain-containing protein (putative c-di-GMP-specific phosphodiesterase class I)
VKIDGSFVRGLSHHEDDDAIVGALIGLAHALGLQAIAEGVETPAQLERLRALGCDMAQGFLFGAPGLAGLSAAPGR